MTKSEQRKVFEAWYCEKFAGYIANMPIGKNGEYIKAQAEVAWRAFQTGFSEAQRHKPKRAKPKLSPDFPQT